MQRFQLFNSTSGVLSLQPALGQACDQCRSRKTGCSREHPCVRCQETGQACSYDQAPKTRGRKVRRQFMVRDTVEPGGAPVESPVPETLGALTDSSCGTTLPNSELMDGPPQMLPLTPFTDTEWQDMAPLRQVISIDSQSVPTPRLHESPWFDNDLKRPQLFTLFPVIEKQSLLELLEAPHLQTQPLPSTIYAFLAALSAAVIVQLGLCDPELSQTDGFESQQSPQSGFVPSALSPELLIVECLETRKEESFIEEADDWTILSSFFLFAYYGNCELPRSAWYYLREAIGFAQSLGLDDPDMYPTLDLKVCQNRRLLFWLLFVTERAYAIQHRSRVMLHCSIDLPHVFDSSEPKLMYGFVTLARVFAAVDNSFVTAWRNQHNPGMEHGPGPGEVHLALQKLLRNDIQVGALPVGEINEIQRLDIMITQHWLKTLAWQLQSSQGATIGGAAAAQQETAASETSDSTCIVEVSKSLLDIIHTADTSSLESHGIGVEQKVSDVANCLCDVIKAQESGPAVYVDFFSTADFLHSFMVFLADFRNHESHYLQPLLCKASSSLCSFVQPQQPLLLEDDQDPATWLEISS